MLLNSVLLPRKFGRTQSTMHQYSSKLFCSGYPVSTILRLVLISFSACEIEAWEFFILCPSSQMTRSGPGETIAFWTSGDRLVMNQIIIAQLNNVVFSLKPDNITRNIGPLCGKDQFLA